MSTDDPSRPNGLGVAIVIAAVLTVAVYAPVAFVLWNRGLL